jgi:hypothetical protein
MSGTKPFGRAQLVQHSETQLHSGLTPNMTTGHGGRPYRRRNAEERGRRSPGKGAAGRLPSMRAGCELHRRHASQRHRGLSTRSVLVVVAWIAYVAGLVMLGILSVRFWN